MHPIQFPHYINPISSASFLISPQHFTSPIHFLTLLISLQIMPCSTTMASPILVSRTTVYPYHASAMEDLKLSVSDLPMLSCHYIQKGCLFTRPQIPISDLIPLLRRSLAATLTHFPPLAGRLVTDFDGYIYITCNDAGVEFVHAKAADVRIRDLLGPTDVAAEFKGFFCFDGAVSYEGHRMPILAVKVTELADGLFIGCSVDHAVTDGTSFWNFFNTFAEVTRGVKRISRIPDFRRESVLISSAVLKLPAGGPMVTFDVDAPLRERIFSFTRESILNIKSKVNYQKWEVNDGISLLELIAKQRNDPLASAMGDGNGKIAPLNQNQLKKSSLEISSFQALCALLWRGVTRARKLPASKTTTFRMAVNCRHRLEPKLEAMYFGNAIQSIPTYAAAGDVLSRDLRWCAEQLNKKVLAHDDGMVRSYIKDWEQNPRTFPLGNFDGAMLTMGSSPRFPMFDNDFGWGRPMAVRSGRANKFDGKISAFPGREGNGSVDLEVVLSPETLTALESDPEFMQYISSY